MILSHAKTQAETFTEQPIKDAVITVPVFFNQVRIFVFVSNCSYFRILPRLNDLLWWPLLNLVASMSCS